MINRAMTKISTHTSNSQLNNLLSYLFMLMNSLLHSQDILLVAAPDTIDKANAVKKDLVWLLDIDVQTYTMPYEKFADTSWNTEFKEEEFKDLVSGKQVWVYADCFSDYKGADLNSKYMFYQHIIETAKDNRAESVNIIYPSFPYARSDKNQNVWSKKKSKKVPTMAKKVMRDASDGFTKNLITLDIHNPAILWMGNDSRLKKTNLEYRRLMEYAMRDLDKSNVEIGSTDLGGTTKIKESANDQWLNNYAADKNRDKTIPNSVKEVMIIPWFAKIKDKDIIIYDDMIDTGGTICQVIDKIHAYWPRSIRIVASHGMFNASAVPKLKEYIEKGIVSEIIVSDSITRKNLPDWITVLPTYTLYANTIASLLQGTWVDRNGAGEFLAQAA